MAKRDTKKVILKALVELSKNRPIDKITVKEISEKCGITSQTFYNHFPDKYELVFWAYRNRVDKVMETYKRGEINNRQAIEEYIRGFGVNQRFILNAFNNMKGQDSYVVKSGVYLSDRMAEAICEQKGIKKLPLKYDFFVKEYACGVINMIAYWLTNEMMIPREEFVILLDEAIPASLKEYCTSDKN